MKLSKERLEEMYHGKGMSITDMAEELGVARSTLYGYMKHLDIKFRGKKVKISEDKLRQLYLEGKASAPEIATIYGCSESTVYRRMREYGIERRDPGDYSHPKIDWEPCADCGTEYGEVPEGKGHRTPVRTDGSRFGFNGVLCNRCYQRHYMREYRKNKKGK